MSLPLAEPRERLCEDMLTRLKDVLRRANYHRLSRDEIQRAMDAALPVAGGVRMRVVFDAPSVDRGLCSRRRGTQKSFRSWRSAFRMDK